MPVDREAGERLQEFMEPRIGKVQPWAELHGIGRDTIYALWRGREPRPDTLSRIARALRVDYMDLLAVRQGAPRATETPADLVTAITLQTAAIDRLVASLERLVLRGPDEAEVEAREERAVRALEGDGRPPRRSSPRGTTGSAGGR